MLDLDVRQPIFVADAPEGCVCEWCGKPAFTRLTISGNIFHEEEHCFCQFCGEKFACAVADTLNREITVETNIEL